MRKCIIACLLCWAFASTVSALESDEIVRLGVDVDWAWSKMDDINKQLNKGENVNSLHSGFAAIGNFDVVATPFLMIGARSGIVFSQPASAWYNYVVYNQKTKIRSYFIPIEAGMSALWELPSTPLSIKAGVYAGYGFAFVSFEHDIGVTGQASSFTQPYKGSSFTGELLATLNLKLSPVLSLNVNSGYRLAKVIRMEQSGNVNYSGIAGVNVPVGAKGDILKDADNENIAFDFSGFNIGAGFSVGF